MKFFLLSVTLQIVSAGFIFTFPQMDYGKIGQGTESEKKSEKFTKNNYSFSDKAQRLQDMAPYIYSPIDYDGSDSPTFGSLYKFKRSVWLFLEINFNP